VNDLTTDAPIRVPARSFLVRLSAFFVILGSLLVFGELAIDHAGRGVSAACRPWVKLTLGLLLSGLMIAVYRVLVILLEKRQPQELSGESFGRFLSSGVLIGLSLFASVYLILWISGALTIDGSGDTSHLLSAMALSITAGFAEEIVLRGVLFRLVEEKLGTIIALLISAGLFGILHLANRGATVASAASVALEAGVLLGLAFAATRKLWFPIGLHIGWNFAEGGIFGAAVSGRESHGIVHASLSGSSLMTGGAFGPEQSLVAVGVSLLASLIFLTIAIRRGQLTPFSLNVKRAVN
jgi:uncharacterized protein